KPIEAAAILAQVRVDTVDAWLRRVTHEGIAPFLGKRAPPPRKLDADPSTFRKLAAKEKNPRVRKRMLALACMAEGMGFYDAEVRSGLTRVMIKKRIERFRREGIAAFEDGENVGRQKRLDASGLKELYGKILSAPEMTVQEVADWLWTQFRVRYSVNG